MNKFMLFLAFIILGLTALPSVATAADRFSIQVPRDWKVKSNAEGLNLAATSPDQKVILTVNISTSDVSLQEFFQGGLDILEKTVKGYSKIETGETHLDGVPANWVIHSAVMADGIMVNWEFFLIKDNYAYLITVSSPAEDFAANRENILKLVNTFKFVP